jgi:hypothetical protein
MRSTCVDQLFQFNSFFSVRNNAIESGMGLPYSKTLARVKAGHVVREVMDCGSPMPLLPSTDCQHVPSRTLPSHTGNRKSPV